MVANVYNILQRKLKYLWEFGTLNVKFGKDPDSELLAHGKKKYHLGENEIGIIIMKDIKKQTMMVELTVPPTSAFYDTASPQGVKMMTHGATDKEYEFTNAEAAALGILSHHERKSGGKNYQKRRQMFEDFGIGPLTKDTTATEIVSLTSKGMIKRNKNHPRPNMRNFPIITAKGKAAANVVDMPLDVFIGEFKKIVQAKPTEQFTLFYMDDAGISE
jgi:hypothetical protein